MKESTCRDGTCVGFTKNSGLSFNCLSPLVLLGAVHYLVLKYLDRFKPVELLAAGGRYNDEVRL